MPQDVVKSGFYGNSRSHFKIEITKKGELFLPTKPEEKYVYTADGSFINEKGTSKLNFVTEKNGKVYLRESTYELSRGIGANCADSIFSPKIRKQCVTEENSCCMGEARGRKVLPR